MFKWASHMLKEEGRSKRLLPHLHRSLPTHLQINLQTLSGLVPTTIHITEGKSLLAMVPNDFKICPAISSTAPLEVSITFHLGPRRM